MFVGTSDQTESDHVVFAYNEAGQVYSQDDQEFVSWVDPDYAAYKITTTQTSPGRYATETPLPNDTTSWELAVDGDADDHEDNVMYDGAPAPIPGLATPDDGTYVLISREGEVTITPVDPDAPPTSEQVTVYGSVVDAQGNPLANQAVALRVVSTEQEVLVTGESTTLTSNGDGVVSGYMPKNSQIEMKFNGKTTQFATTDEDTQLLPSLVGKATWL